MLKIGKIRSASTTFTLLYLIYAAGEVSIRLVFFSSGHLFLFLIKDYVKGIRVQGLGGVIEGVRLPLLSVMFMAQGFLVMRFMGLSRSNVIVKSVASLLVPLNFVTEQRAKTRWDAFEASV